MKDFTKGFQNQAQLISVGNCRCEAVQAEAVLHMAKMAMMQRISPVKLELPEVELMRRSLLKRGIMDAAAMEDTAEAEREALPGITSRMEPINIPVHLRGSF